MQAEQFEDSRLSLSKKFYRISEVAELLNVPASTLRFWEKEFTIVHPKRNDHGTRYYTPADVETISMIHYLVKVKGLKLDAAQEQLRRNPSGVSRRFHAIERLKSVRATLRQMLDQLDTRR